MILSMLPQKILSALVLIALASLQWGCASTHANHRSPDVSILSMVSTLSSDERLKAYEGLRIQALQGRYAKVDKEIYSERAIARYFKLSDDPQALKLWTASRGSSAAAKIISYIVPALGPVLGALGATVYHFSTGLLSWQSLHWEMHRNSSFGYDSTSSGGLQSPDWSSVDRNTLMGMGIGLGAGVGVAVILRKIYMSSASTSRMAAGDTFNRNLANKLNLAIEPSPKGINIMIKTEF